MKRIISLLLAMVMVLSIVPVASAAVPSLPATTAGFTDIPEKPSVPEYTLTVVDDHYELTLADGSNKYDYVDYGGDTPDWEWSSVGLRWNEDKQAYVSDALLGDAYTEHLQLTFQANNDDGTNEFVNIDPASNTVNHVSASEWQDGISTTYRWEDDVFNFYQYNTNDSSSVDAYYSSNGKINYYWYNVSDTMNIQYDKYGNIDMVETHDDDYNWYQWDFSTQQWVSWEGTVYEADPFVSADHPPLVVLPYEMTTPPSSVTGTTEGVTQGGDYYYYYGENSYARYDLDGNLEQYTITTEDGVTLSYDPYGRLYWAEATVDGVSYDWDKASGVWLDANGNVTTSVTFDVDGYQAPIVLDYVIETPPATFDPNGEGFESEEWGDYYYGDNISAEYDEAGNLTSYTVTTLDNLNISYDKYGRINWVDMGYENGYCSWNEDQQAWIYYNFDDGTETVMPDLEPFNPDEHPAPYAAPYVVTLPPTTLEGVGVNISDLTPVKLGEVSVNDDAFVTISDEDYAYVYGNYAVTNEDGSTSWFSVDFYFNEETNSWESYNALPEGVTASDLEISVNDVNWKSTYYVNGEWESISMNSVTKYADGSHAYWGYDKYNAAAFYDANGNMTSYQYSDLNQTFTVQYDMEGTVLYYNAVSEDGNRYSYTVDKGWTVYDAEKGMYVPAEKPADLNPEEDTKPLILKAQEPEVIWYPYNTMCVAGISLKDTYGITDKWYNVVPVDLTKDGTQTFDLVASGMFLIGKAAVTVEGDNVTVTYGMPWGHGYIKEEVLNWFTSPSQITAEFCEAPTGAYAFGEPVSITEDLGGADVGLLFICNRVTYRQPYYNNGAHLVRWYSNKPEWKAFREQLMTIMPE